MADKSDKDIWIVYDGECPFCSAYVRLVRLRETAGTVHLLNAREPHAVVSEVQAKGFDLDEGMALKVGDAIYHGPDVMNRLALMSGENDLFNRFHLWIFSNPKRAKFLYPFLKTGRNATLRLLGRRKIGEADGAVEKA